MKYSLRDLHTSSYFFLRVSLNVSVWWGGFLEKAGRKEARQSKGVWFSGLLVEYPDQTISSRQTDGMSPNSVSQPCLNTWVGQYRYRMHRIASLTGLQWAVHLYTRVFDSWGSRQLRQLTICTWFASQSPNCLGCVLYILLRERPRCSTYWPYRYLGCTCTQKICLTACTKRHHFSPCPYSSELTWYPSVFSDSPGAILNRSKCL